jgi:uncharacterized protein (DUF2249 family)
MSLDTAVSRATLAAIPSASEAPPDESGDNGSVIAAIRGHHAQLAEQLRALTSAVLDGTDVPAHERLVDWYRTVLIPHAEAEERALYAPAGDLEPTRLLVAGMVAEHRFLVNLISELAAASNALDVATAAVATHALFTVHLSKENDLLLPALDLAGVDLGASLAGMHEILGETGGHDHADQGCGCGCSCSEDAADDSGTALLQIVSPANREDAAAEGAGDGSAHEGELDVRLLPHGARHEIIFAKLDALESGDALVIVNDHDPKPLRYQTEALWPQRYVWSYLASGPQVWRVAITRAS